MDYGSRPHGRIPSADSDHEMSMHGRRPSAPLSLGHHHLSRRKDSMQHSHPKPPLTPNTSTMSQSMANPLPSAPASPPTPAPSPTPHQRPPVSYHFSLDDSEDPVLEEAKHCFMRLNAAQKENWLRSLVDCCDNHSLSFLHQIVSPRLKKDPFQALPNELCFRVWNLWCWPNKRLQLTSDRYSNAWTMLKPLFAPLKFQGGGGKSLAMTKPGKHSARSMLIGECQLTQLVRV